jgi:hypothetical protein
MKCRRKKVVGSQSSERCVGGTNRPWERGRPESRVLGSGDTEAPAHVHGAGEHQEELRVLP